MDFGYDYGYQYEVPMTYHSGISDSVAAAILSIYLIVLTVVLIFTLTSYIFHSIGLYTIGKRLGKEHPWLAFIPFARDYFHGELAGEIVLKTRSIKNPGIWKLVLPIAFNVVTGIFVGIVVLAAVLGILGGGFGVGILTIVMLYALLLILIIVYNAAFMTFRIFINLQIYERFTTHNMGLVHAVLSVLLPLYEAICLFIMRNRDFIPGREPKLGPPPVMPVYPGGPVLPPAPSAGPEHGPAAEPPIPSAEPEHGPAAEPPAPGTGQETPVPAAEERPVPPAEPHPAEVPEEEKHPETIE